MRSDAVRRREAIIKAARRGFSAHGSEIALDRVAEAAGVGIATLYRNFPSRTALADQVALAILGDVRAAAEEATASLDAHPEAAWSTFIHRLVDLDLGALAAALTEHLTDGISEPVRTEQGETLERVGSLLAAVRDAGLVRSDLQPLELILAIGLITRPLPDPLTQGAPDLVARMVDFLQAGMRPQSKPTLLRA